MRHRDVDVFAARQIPARTEEPVTLVPQVEQSANRHELALPRDFLAATLWLLSAALTVVSATTASPAVTCLDLTALTVLGALIALIAPPGLGMLLRLALRTNRGRHVGRDPIEGLGARGDRAPRAQRPRLSPALAEAGSPLLRPKPDLARTAAAPSATASLPSLGSRSHSR